MEVKLYIVKPRVAVSRDVEFNSSVFEERELSTSYEDYMKPALLWATVSTEKIARDLSVRKVATKGGYIMGLFGGEKKEGEELYAGLVVERYRESNGVAYIKLVNLESEYPVSVDLMKQYGVGIYKLYYMGLIIPFKCSTHDILLSARGEGELKEFLKALVAMNRGRMPVEDSRKLATLVRELRTSIDRLNKGSHYVVYRRSGVFAACVPENLDRAVTSDKISYAECYSSEQAYYYTAILNYLAYIVVREGRNFIRDQFAKPLLAVAIAGLSWSDAPEDLRREVSEYSQRVSESITWFDYANKKKALLDIARIPEFSEVIYLLDEYVERNRKQERLRDALDLVSTRESKDSSTS